MKKILPVLIALMTPFLLRAQPALVVAPKDFQIESTHPCMSEECAHFISQPTIVDRDFQPKVTARDFPKMAWPLGNQLYDELFMMNYFDESNPGNMDNIFQDYECGNNLGYDGHTGTDITVFNFRLMDKGMPIYAAADGVVANVAWHVFDRNYGPPYPTSQANIVRLRHDDGTQSVYVHLRKNSIAVSMGETVKKGQFLGYMGSSGWTPIPHLHIEFWEASSTGWPNIDYRDPWEGTCNNEASLWEEQLAYVPDNKIWIMDMGITTVEAVGGDLSNLSINPFKDLAEEPIVYGTDQEVMLAWVQLQSPPGETYKIDIHHPNGEVIVSSEEQTIQSYIRYWWHPYGWGLTGFEPSDLGTWTMKIYTNGTLLKEHQFTVGEKTYYKPRFYPLNGRSFRMGSLAQTDTLQLSTLSAPATFHLVNAPDYVILKENIVTVEPSRQTFRSDHFQVVATDSLGYTDTMWYHIIDPLKPVGEQTTSIFDKALNPNLSSLTVYPNPVKNELTVDYQLKEQQTLSFALYDLLGQQKALLQREVGQSEGKHQFSWNRGGQQLAAGVYFLVATDEAGRTKATKVVLAEE